MVKRKVTKSESGFGLEDDFGLGLDDSDLDDFIAEHEAHISIDEHALDEELKQQILSYYEVSKKLGVETSKRDAAKTFVKEVEARVDVALREEARSLSAKTTETEIGSKRQVHPDVVEANRVYTRYSSRVRSLEALSAAFSQRAFVLRDLCSLWIASYYSDSGGDAADRQVRDVDARTNKKKLNEARNR